MKLIIAGGRDYRLTQEDFNRLDTLNIGEVVTGKSRGADADGDYYAHLRMLPLKNFSANWATNGKAAGPMRNRQMAQYADAVALFPGGKGTNSMYREAQKAGIKIYDYRNLNLNGKH